MPVVGTLTVDLVANTASFSGDLGKAAQSAEDFGKDASAAGEQVDFSMREARGSMMLLGEEVGVHIPRHLQALIAEIPGVGVAFAEMLPIVGVVAAIAIIVKLIEKSDEAQHKMDESWAAIGRSGEEAMDALRIKTLQVQEATQKLAGDSLGALKTAIQIINLEKLDAIDKEFQKLGTEADKTFEGMKVGWMRTYLLLEGNDAGVAAVNERFQKLVETVDEYKKKGDDKGIIDTLDAEHSRLQMVIASMSDQNTYTKTLHDANEKALALVDQEIAAYKERDKAAQGQTANLKTEQAHVDYSIQEKARAAYAKSLTELNKEIEKSDEEVARKFNAQLEIEMRAETRAVDEKAKLAQESNRVTQQTLDQQTQAAIKAAQEQFKTEEENSKHMVAMHRETAAQAAAQDVDAAKAETAAEVAALNARLGTLDTFAKDYEKKVQELHNKIAEIEQQGAAKVKQIEDQSDAQRIQALTQAENRMGQIFASTAAKSILEGKNMAQAFAHVGAQMLEQAAENALQLETIQGRQKLANAKAAYGDAYTWAAPAGPIAGAIAGSLAFASVMAFAEGGEVPGVGPGDTVPAMLTPGETVVTKSLTDQVKNSRGGGGHTFHFAPTVNAVDSDGVADMLDKHEAVFTAKMTSILRKNHKG
jgi:hypothetical protein